jgi:phosphoketolase
MWLVVHMTYTNKVNFNGSALDADDFKSNPQGHTGGSLNMVPAYAGYMVANRLAGITRSWLMGQGHCVAAIDAVNVLLQNLYPEQAERYPLSEQGLTQLARDFYSYAMADDGRPGVPLG